MTHHLLDHSSAAPTAQVDPSGPLAANPVKFFNFGVLPEEQASNKCVQSARC